MSGTFPASPAPMSADFRSVTPTLVSVAHSLKRQARSRGGQRWGVRLIWAPMTRASFAAIWAFCVAQRGQFGTFQWVLPTPLKTPRGSFSGTPLVNGASQTGRSLSVDGFTAGASNVARAGDFIKLADSKVYMVTEDASANGSGQATLAIEPALIASPADNEPVASSSVQFTMMLASDVIEHPLRPPSLFSYQVDMMEAY